MNNLAAIPTTGSIVVVSLAVVWTPIIAWRLITTFGRPDSGEVERLSWFVLFCMSLFPLLFLSGTFIIEEMKIDFDMYTSTGVAVFGVVVAGIALFYLELRDRNEYTPLRLLSHLIFRLVVPVILSVAIILILDR